HDVARVRDALHVADLVAVVRGDRELFDALPGFVELEDDLGVEVETVRVALERNPLQRCDTVGAVPAVPLAEIHADDGILNWREDPIADVLVERHAASP